MLLELDRVTHRYPRGARGRSVQLALRDVTLAVRPGEVVGVWGARRSGRSTLLLAAAGMLRPTEGSVRFDGAELDARPALGLPGGIGFCDRDFDPTIGQTVLEHVASPLLSGATSNRTAERRAFDQLERVGATELAELEPDELSTAEALRVSIARATIAQPRLLLVDEPVTVVPGSHERPLLRLLHSFARQEEMAVLMTADDVAALIGVDRALSLMDGVLRGAVEPTPLKADPDEPAPRVVPLRSRRAR